MNAKIAWKRDHQGLHAEIPGEHIKMYVRRDGKTWRFGTGAMVRISDTWFASADPIEWLDRADTQRMAKAVAEAYAAEPWSDGGSQGRITRAITKAYAA